MTGRYVRWRNPDDILPINQKVIPLTRALVVHQMQGVQCGQISVRCCEVEQKDCMQASLHRSDRVEPDFQDQITYPYAVAQTSSASLTVQIGSSKSAVTPYSLGRADGVANSARARCCDSSHIDTSFN